ncbi:UV-endonuclease uvdE domain-containing protein [Hirsutella rhossiliensis]|uniref:UV-endonuclease uvdE domain-containing protein n=1 Tax=Hirsutella rhossiliensis TaxID=111463 RepID=A0A9P8N6Q8_9HYPO|nr:UV-endonuclease uvdE domain-containing protein [Hirsutella rhossiliensis]KAH0967840.1 UV-endonuclease uvdE domain-containing protein [Hirsutella rhossiliensis]
MPPKRKRTGPQPRQTRSPPTQSDTPRRSSRRTAKGAEQQRDGPSKSTATLSLREAVERAMQDLSQIEHKLHSDAKRQRLAVESSDLSVLAEAGTADQPSSTASTMAAAAAKNRPHDDAAPGVAGAALDVNAILPGLASEGDVQERGARRRPPVNSEKLPLPWSGRLGYACLNTYLRAANPPVFCSRTCRLTSILEHRHPLLDPSQPEHATKNRPDKSQPADVKRGLAYMQDIGFANAADIVKMIRWNDNHKEHGYRLAPFASGVLAKAGRVAAELGHRLTTHPGQFTQIGSPRPEVVEAAMRDLEYHNEMLSLLKLPDQLNRDAIMILHMGGTYGDKDATLARFRNNYAKLSDGVKRRLALENDDVSWSVHDLLPICEELNIPLVLDFHHHNIVFDPSIREGTHDIVGMYSRIRATWTRKMITQKMHYSEPTAAAVTPRDRRKHSPRVKTLPPCAPDMDLMIEAKDSGAA